MTAQSFTITGSPEVIKELITTLKAEGCQVSQPVSSKSVADALDAPIGADELRAVLEIITVASTATVAIVSAIVKVVKEFESETVRVGDAKTGRELAEATRTTDEATLRGKLEAKKATT